MDVLRLTDESVEVQRDNSAKPVQASEVTVGMLPLDAVAGSGLNVSPIPDRAAVSPSDRANHNRPNSNRTGRPNRSVEPTVSPARGRRPADRRSADNRPADASNARRTASLTRPPTGSTPCVHSQRSVPPIHPSAAPRTQDSLDDTDGDSREVLALFEFSDGPSTNERKLMPRHSDVINNRPDGDFSDELNGTAKRNTRALARESDRVPQEEFSADEYWNQVYDADDYVEGDSEGESSDCIDYQDMDVHGDDSVNESLEDRLDLSDDELGDDSRNEEFNNDATNEQQRDQRFDESRADASRERRSAVRSLSSVFSASGLDRANESIGGRTHLPKKAVQIVAADTTSTRPPKQQGTWKVLTVNTGLHVLLLLLLALTVVPGPDEPDGLSISSSMDNEMVADLLEKEELDAVVEIAQLPPTEVQTDLVMETDDRFTINEDNLAPSVTAPVSKAATGPAAVAPVKGQISGPSQAGKSAMLVRYGGTEASEAAVVAGLNWLGQHQWKDGS